MFLKRQKILVHRETNRVYKIVASYRGKNSLEYILSGGEGVTTHLSIEDVNRLFVIKRGGKRWEN